MQDETVTTQTIEDAPEAPVTKVKKDSLLIFDLDSIIFTVAWRYKDRKTKGLVSMHTNEFIRDVLKNANPTDYVGFYAQKGEDTRPNFRYAVSDIYKANRPPTPDFVVKWRDTIVTEFINWGFVGIDGMEADDAVAIAANHYRDDYEKIMVASFDKDLRQIPDIDYYYMKDHTITPINEFEAAYNLCKQMLTGDSTDNIKGIPKIGPKKADVILADATTPYGLMKRVVGAYKDYHGKVVDKANQAIKDEVKAEVDKLIADQEPEAKKFDDMTAKQLERYIRIEAKKRGFKEGSDWREYFNQQRKLLTMLHIAPEWFTIPEPRSNPVAEEKAKIEKVKAQLDDFLTV